MSDQSSTASAAAAVTTPTDREIRIGARVRCSTRRRVRDDDRSEADPGVVGTAWRHHDRGPDGRPDRRLGERTKITTTSIFHTPEERDGFLASGMEGGLNETYSRLDEVLARIAAE